MATPVAGMLLDMFQSHEIDTIFCSPGSEWVPFWDCLLSRYGQGKKDPKYINCRHEVLAVSAAMGYAKTTGRLPAVLLHSGVGPLNAAMAIRGAYQSQVPMIIFSAESLNHENEAGIKAPGPYWINQLSDIGGPSTLVRPYVKWSNAVNSERALLDSVYRGCQIAQSHPQGPVFISLPMKFLQGSLPELRIAQPSPVARLPEPRSGDLKFVAKKLFESNQPVIITEYAGKSMKAVTRLTELAEMLSIPVFECTLPVYANFPKNHPLYMGGNATTALAEADTVFVVGGTVPWYPPSAFPNNGTTVILLNESPLHERLPYWGYHVDLLLSGNLEQWLSSLVYTVNDLISKSDYNHRDLKEDYAKWHIRHEQIMQLWEKEALDEQENKPISSKWFPYIASKVLPADSLILEETILHRHMLHRYLAEPGRYVSVSWGGLGIGLGEAIGNKLAWPDKALVFIVGDGVFNYSPVLAGLGLCQEYHLPILIIVLNNGGYMAMKKGFHRLCPDGWAASHKSYLGVDIAPAPDYARVAEALDAYGERLEEPQEIEPALKRALKQVAHGKVSLLDVLLDTP